NGQDYGPTAHFIPAWANGPGHRHTQPISANGAIHPSGIVRHGVMNGAWRRDRPGFQPLLCFAMDYLGTKARGQCSASNQAVFVGAVHYLQSACRSLPNDFHQHTLSAASIELAIKDLLP